ncbi:MAG: ABC transporter ATP-binding protein [Desulfovibrionaceae bacterium]|nr:ABC transporter ATP-binding protein [Desulfovibrionaceae bacterium]MBF0514990.1 ABC transporter ATP-binding protein [Desulfovibrionaceae bacterium]
MNAVIEAVGLRKCFGTFTAVDGVSFRVEAGSVFGLLGPNGAGKTTTIRILYGFSPLTEGRVTVFGLDIAAHHREIKARIGVCQQDNTLDPDLSVEQNLLVFAGYFLMDAKIAAGRARELLSFFALDGKRKAKVMELSGGMIRRLMLARALINSPELLILDEPTTGLDPQSRHQLWDKLTELKAAGLTILLTTHYMEEAARLCDTLVIVDHGKILVQGSPAELIRDHAGRFVLEIEGRDPQTRRFAKESGLRYDLLEQRVILYSDGDEASLEEARRAFCPAACLTRQASLEDVFLRLTGRELRE